MPNDYYNRVWSDVRGITARAIKFVTEFTSLETAFDTIQAVVKRSIKLPADVTTDQVITENAAARASKFVGFDASGNLQLGALVASGTFTFSGLNSGDILTPNEAEFNALSGITTLPDAAATNTWSATQTFNAAGDYDIEIQSTAPGIKFLDTNAPADEGFWDQVIIGTQMRWRVRSDDGVSTANFMTATRTGTNVAVAFSVTGFTLNGSTVATLGGNIFVAGQSIQAASGAHINLYDTDATVDEKWWQINGNADQFRLIPYTDAGSAGTAALTMARTGNTVDSIAFAATAMTFNGSSVLTTVTGAVKTANETISGFWTFNASPTLSGPAPSLILEETDAGTDQGFWDIKASAETLLGRILSDDAANTATWLTVNRSGTGAGVAIDSIALTATAVTINGSNVLLADSNQTLAGTNTFSQSPIFKDGIEFDNDAATADNGRHSIFPFGDFLKFATVSDDGLTVDTWLEVAGGSPLSTIDFDPDGATSSTKLKVAGQTVWHAGNDGASSGLDADLLDGAEGAAYTKKASAETITGGWTFTTTAPIFNNGNSFDARFRATSPAFSFEETDAATDEQYWGFLCSGGQLRFDARNDAQNVVNTWLVVDRTGATVDAINLAATTVKINGDPAVTNPATGTSSFAAGPASDPAAAGGNASTAVGPNASASGNDAIALGQVTISTPQTIGWSMHSSGAQIAGFKVIEADTTDATATKMADGAAADGVAVPASRVVTLRGIVQGRESGGGEVAIYEIDCAAQNNGGTTTLLYGGTPTVLHESTGTMDCAVAVNDTTDRIEITVTGVAATTMKWSAHLSFVELAA